MNPSYFNIAVAGIVIIGYVIIRIIVYIADV